MNLEAPDSWLSRSSKVAIEAEVDEKSLLNRSPQFAKVTEGVKKIKLSRQAQQLLGCVVNEDVFLESPYAYVSREVLLELSRREDSLFGDIATRVADCTQEQLLIGYAAEKIEADDADFLICLSEDARRALVSRNRWITQQLLEAALRQVTKLPSPWQEQGSGAELESSFVRPGRTLHEVSVSIPVRELLEPKRLSARSAREARDGYVELVPLHEEFENVEIRRLGKACQTQLESRDSEAQTYPGHPKNQWTQYEFEVEESFSNIWKADDDEGDDVEESEKGSGAETSSASKEEKEASEEELRLRESKRREWEKLAGFLSGRSAELIDAVSFNAAANFYVNDVADLGGRDEASRRRGKLPAPSYGERASLVDLRSVGDRCLLAASWHCARRDLLVCAYSEQAGRASSLLALWSLPSPLQPRLLLSCERQLSALSFCPLGSYANILVGACLDGKVLVWEIASDWLAEQPEKPGVVGVQAVGPPLKEATIALSGERSQSLSVTSIEWLPTWCRIEADGNFQKVAPDSGKQPRPQFATASADGSLYFWSLPRSLASPATLRSPLHLTISPTYRLLVQEPDEKAKPAKLELDSFCLPLARSEESSNRNVRDQADLERLRKVFVGTSKGEVMCCTWEGQALSVAPADRELCRVSTRACVHDGRVRTMAKSPHLDDVFLSVGGRVFALWKEDLPDSPVFRRRSKGCLYGEGCWSGRPGMIVLARLDGCFELWDLKRKPDEPALLQTVSDKMTPYVYPSPPSCNQKLLAVLEGASSLRIFVEPEESADDEDLERIEWLEEFAWRETRRKLDFQRWQEEYLRQHPVALKRKAEREQAEVARRHREARDNFLRVLGIICIALGSPGYSAGVYYVFVAVTAFVISVIWSMIYLFSVREALRLPINWVLTELLNTGLYTVLYLTASIIELIFARWASYVAAGIFGLFNTLAYAAGTYYLYLEHINNQR